MKKKDKWHKRFKWASPSKMWVLNKVRNGGIENQKHYKTIEKEGKGQLKELRNEINKFELDEKYRFQRKKGRKIKTTTVWDFEIENGNIGKKVKHVSIGEWKKYMGLNKTNRLVGTTPDYIGYHMQHPYTKPNFIELEIGHNLDEIYDRFPNIKEAIIRNRLKPKEGIGGALDTNLNHLREFTRDNKGGKYTLEQIIEICHKSDWFDYPEVEFTNLEEIDTLVNHNPNTSNGHYTGLYSGYKFKGLTLTESVHIAKQKIKEVWRTSQRNYCLWDIAGREKRIKTDPESKNKRQATRLIMNPEQYFSIINGWIFQKFMASIEQACGDNSKFFIRGELDGEKYTKIIERLVNKDYIVDTDWSQFDSSMDTEYIQAAVILLFGNSIKRKEDMRLFYYILSGLVTKYICIPPGLVVELNRGGPSGHNGITLINNIINKIRFALIGYELYGDKYGSEMDLVVYGDDGLIGFNYSNMFYRIDSFIENQHWGNIDIYGRIYPARFVMAGENDTPDFLKRRLKITGIEWNEDKAIETVLYLVKDSDITNQIGILDGYINTSSNLTETNEFLRYIRRLIIKRYPFINKWIPNEIDEDVGRKYYRGKTRSYIEGIKLTNRLLSTGISMTMTEYNLLKQREWKFKVDRHWIKLLRYTCESVGFLHEMKERNKKYIKFFKSKTTDIEDMVSLEILARTSTRY